MPLLILTPPVPRGCAPGVLWLHGGGYLTGMKEMACYSRAADLVTRFGAVVFAPDYTLSWRAPYPAAMEDCYAALRWLRENAAALGVDDSRLSVGGESAGGGLTAALCMLARDRGEVRVAYQMPLCPRLPESRLAAARFNRHFADAMARFSAPQD